MEHLISGLSVLSYWETYVLCLIYMLIYMPISVRYVHGEGLSMSKSFLTTILGVLLQAFATIFLFVAIYGVIYADLSLGVSAIDSLGFLFELGSNRLGTALGLIFLIVIVLMFFSGGDFDFLVGIFVYSILISGSLIPAIPDFFIILLIIFSALFNLFITPAIIIPLAGLIGISKISLQDPQNTMTMKDILLMNFFQNVVGLVPAMIYLSWLMTSL